MRTQKDEILRVMKESCRHMTAEEIVSACRAQGKKISVATVYRNLGLMVESGSLRRVPVPGQPDRYDVTVADHGHKVCDACGEVTDLGLSGMKAEWEARTGIAVTDYDLCVHYVCPSCVGKQTQKGEKT